MADSFGQNREFFYYQFIEFLSPLRNHEALVLQAHRSYHHAWPLGRGYPGEVVLRLGAPAWHYSEGLNVNFYI